MYCLHSRNFHSFSYYSITRTRHSTLDTLLSSTCTNNNDTHFPCKSNTEILFSLDFLALLFLLYKTCLIPILFPVQSSPDVIQFELESYNSDGRRGNIQKKIIYTGKNDNNVKWNENNFFLTSMLFSYILKNTYKIEVYLMLLRVRERGEYRIEIDFHLSLQNINFPSWIYIKNVIKILHRLCSN
jgi:hypothetical protein